MSYDKKSKRLASITKTQTRVIKAARRVVLETYPAHSAAFTTMAEVESYLSGDRVVCLECGKSYEALPRHLACVHLMTTDDYKTKYGIPYSRGLIGAALHEIKAEFARQLVSEGKIGPSFRPATSNAAGKPWRAVPASRAVILKKLKESNVARGWTGENYAERKASLARTDVEKSARRSAGANKRWQRKEEREKMSAIAKRRWREDGYLRGKFAQANLRKKKP